MNKRKIIGSAVLVLGLLATGASFADDNNAPAADKNTSYGKEVFSKIANMTPEQREAFRAQMREKMKTMTPEQREAFRDEMRSSMAGMSKEERETFRAEMKEKMDKMSPEERANAKAEHMKHRAERMERCADGPKK